jgi:hypothetical protein
MTIELRNIADSLNRQGYSEASQRILGVVDELSAEGELPTSLERKIMPYSRKDRLFDCRRGPNLDKESLKILASGPEEDFLTRSAKIAIDHIDIHGENSVWHLPINTGLLKTLTGEELGINTIEELKGIIRGKKSEAKTRIKRYYHGVLTDIDRAIGMRERI